MGLLKKPYEVSLWEDVWDSSNKKFDETRTLTIGSSEMEYPGRAIEPNLVRKTNGEVSFSFKMYYQFVDTTTGETVNNPFVDYIANETKIKLKYGDEWFDLLVKNVHKDSATKSYTYQLVDQHMTELSKNGFDVQLDSKLFNNLGTAEELGLRVLQNTDWGVESEKIVQTQDEALVMLKVSTEGGIQAYQINDTNLTENGAMPAATTTTIPKDACIYAFYSSCSGEKPYRFQFIYKKTDRGEGKNPRYVYDSFEIQSDRIIADQNCQYYIDGITEWVESSGFTIPKDFAIDTREISLDGINNKSAISVLYRGRRYVYSQTSGYHPGLDMYLQKYRDREQNEYYKYQKTEYVAPSLIQNVVNNAEFKGTSAWKGSKFLADGNADIDGKPASSPEFSTTVETVSMYDDGNVLADATDVMLGYTAVNNEGANWSSVIGNTNYKPYLRCGNLHPTNGITKAIINSGTSDTVAFQQGITEGEQYIFDIEAYLISKLTQFALGPDSSISMVTYSEQGRVYPQMVVANFDYDASLNGYDTDDYTNRATSEKVLFEGKAAEDPVILAAKNTVTPEKMRDDNYQIFLFPGTTDRPSEFTNNFGVHYHTEYFVLIKKIQFYKFYSKGENSHYTPDDDMSPTEVSYVVEDRYFPVVPDDTRTLDEITFAPITNTFVPVLSADGSKKSTVNVKESNYFNAIQAIASTFECWPQLEVNHDATGKIVNFPNKDYSKRIHFKNYVGQKNHVGFKYGVNSKDIKRTLDSNQIVSKLIVKANSNEYAPNGFCTIARAPANSVKDNVLYNFDYYVSQKMLDAAALQNDLHIAGSGELETLASALSRTTLEKEEWASNILVSCTGYYSKMRIINQKLENLQKLIAEKNTPLIAETATYNTYKAMYEAAVSDLEEQQDRFFKLAGFAYNAIPGDKQEEVMNSTTLFSTLQTIAELAATEQDAKAKYEAAEENMEAYSSAILTLENQQKNAILLKEVLNNMFYTRYSRFIQEGTWIDESYLDESLYYNDALSVSYNSAMPKVTYSMNVLSLAGLPGYELFDFKVGDQTFVEDTEFFGYDTTGTPIRAEVTITQTSENLDDPTKNTIQIRNYENQFEDLFQRINATVQSVQYSEGSYKKAAEFVEADAAHKFSFLNDALSAAEAYIGDTNNTVVVDTSGGTGITITDKNNAEQALRLTSGAILLKGTNPDTGEKVWKTGLTAEGISASLINAGILNTGEINIMNGSEPTFRWDTHGITAYNFDNSTSDTFFGIDKTKGVRFDRFGLYGYEGINGESWRPTGINTGINSIEEYSTFYLTWEGLKVKGQEETELRIGKNALDDFILSVSSKEGDPSLSITNSGNLTVKGTIVAEGGSLSIGGTAEAPNFHVDENGNVTMNGGITLAGNITWGAGGAPDELKGDSGRGISSTTTDYQKHSSGTEPPTGSWSATVPSISSGEFLWTRTTFTYTDNTTSVSYGVSSKGSRGSSGTSITVAGVQYAKGENATTPPTRGWSINIPAVSGTYPYLWTRTVFSDGSEAYNCSKNTITKDELWSFLGTDDGIYENNGNIAIRATAIISGALQVGGTKGQPNSEGVKFYADVTNNAVKIGNWNVGNPGGSFTNSLYSEASDNTDTYNVILRASTAPTDYAFAIIKNLGATGQEEIFGIHHNGKLYAKNIEIAGGTISLGDNFNVDKDGNLVAYNCDLNGFTFRSSTDGKASIFSSKGGSYALKQYNNNEAEFFLNENSKIRIGQGGLKLTNDTIAAGHSYTIATASTRTVSEIGIGYNALIPSFASEGYADDYNVGIQLYKRSDYGSGNPYAPAGWVHICLDEFGRIQARTATWQVNQNQDDTADPRNEGAPRLKNKYLVYAGTLKIQGDLYVNDKEISGEEIASLKLEVQQLREELAALKN